MHCRVHVWVCVSVYVQGGGGEQVDINADVYVEDNTCKFWFKPTGIRDHYNQP